jgi:hypothetical protein
MGMAVHFTHLALVVMVMDLCFNKHENDEVKTKAEVKAALQMFENASNVSPLLARFLSSLCDVLQKHKVHLADSSAWASSSNVGAMASEIMVDVSINPYEQEQMPFTGLGGDGMLDPGATLGASFDELWQSAVHGEANADSIMWDNLFSSLDSRHL